jgi:pimeloyl-ACP methyl ester carboxylesterase
MPKYPSPVIFLPGIMGSALRDEYPVSPETVWSTFRLLIQAYDRITPHPDDTRWELQEPARVARDQVFELVYSEIIEELRHNLSPEADEPVPVFPFAYDWRQPLEPTEDLLDRFIDEVIDRTRLLRHYDKAQFGSADFPAKVSLVAHSMGGLIVAGYLGRHGDGKVDKVATIATPFRGSVEAVAKVATGAGALGTSPNGSRERETARVTPALYYLLPSFAGAVEAVAGLSSDLFVPSAWQPGIIDSLASFLRMYGRDQTTPPATQAAALLGTMLSAARAHRTAVESLALADSKRWLCLVGVNEKVRVKMAITRDAQGAPWFGLPDAEVVNDWARSDPAQRVNTGDNTVPYLGARASFIPTAQVVCVTPDDFAFWEIKDRILEKTGFHSSLPNMNLVQRLVASHLKGARYGDVWGRRAPDLPAGAQWDPPIAGLVEK